jgi:hypothetical protein
MTMSNQVQSYYPKRAKLLLLLVGCVLFTASMVWTLLDPTGVPPKIQLISWVGVPALGFVSLYLLVRLISRAPSLQLDAEGLRDNASIFSAGFIPWEDIEAVTVYSVGGGRMVGIVLKDNDKFLARLGPVRRALSSVNIKKGYPLIAIPEMAVSVSADELKRDIERMLAARATKLPE